jgi:hypothetical protein
MLTDEEGLPGVGSINVELSVNFTVHAGDPGCRWDDNGDGCPATPPEVEITSWTVERITAGCGGAPVPDGVLSPEVVVEWVAARIESDRESIEGELLAYAEDTP